MYYCEAHMSPAGNITNMSVRSHRCVNLKSHITLTMSNRICQRCCVIVDRDTQHVTQLHSTTNKKFVKPTYKLHLDNRNGIIRRVTSGRFGKGREDLQDEVRAVSRCRARRRAQAGNAYRSIATPPVPNLRYVSSSKWCRSRIQSFEYHVSRAALVCRVHTCPLPLTLI